MKRLNYSSTSITLFSMGVVLVLVGFWGMFSGRVNQSIEERFAPNNAKDKSAIIQVSRFKQLTTDGGFLPFFSADGHQVYYFSQKNALVTIGLGTGEKEIHQIQEMPKIISSAVSVCGKKGLIEVVEDDKGYPTLAVINLARPNLSIFAEKAWGGAWSSDCGEIIYFLDNGERAELMRGNIFTKRSHKLDGLSDVFAPFYVGWSEPRNRLLVQGAQGLAIYYIENGSVTQINWIPGAKEASWSPDGWHILYKMNDADTDSLWISNIDGNALEKIWEGKISEANWTADGTVIFFTPGKLGGAACWRLDPLTKTKELIADSTVVYWKPVGSFDVSPENGSAVFLAQDENIWLVEFQAKGD